MLRPYYRGFLNPEVSITSQNCIGTELCPYYKGFLDSEISNTSQNYVHWDTELCPSVIEVSSIQRFVADRLHCVDLR